VGGTIGRHVPQLQFGGDLRIDRGCKNTRFILELTAF
jgi:hypothetical protein